MRTKIFDMLPVFLLLFSGCGDGRPICYPVSGILQVDGQPLTGEYDGTVRFVPVNGQRPASGTLDSQGRFQLTTYEKGDGCPRGTYRVEILALQTKGNKTRYLVPPRYLTSATSDLQVEIEGKTSDLLLEVHWLPEDVPFQTPRTVSDGAS